MIRMGFLILALIAQSYFTRQFTTTAYRARVRI